MKQKSNIIKFHKQIQFNIGFVIIAIVLLYVLFHLFSYITEESITVYEVTEGSISKDNSYQALAVRQEQVITSETAGDLIYYASNLEQVGVRSNIFSVDSTGKISEQLKELQQSLDTLEESDITRLSTHISDFIYDVNSDDFHKVYGFKADLSYELQQAYRTSVLEEMQTEIMDATSHGQFVYYKAPCAGTVVYQTDGLEDLKLEDVSEESFDKKNIKISNLKNQSKIKKGQAVYKLITSDLWNLVLKIDKETAQTYIADETEYVEIKFTEDNATTWAQCTIEKKGTDYYMILSLDDSVERYANSRFLDIYLLSDQQSGLKIPNSAIVEKEFFTIPKEYFFKGNNADQVGLMVQRNNDKAEFVTPTIYRETDDAYYIDGEKIQGTDKILKPNTSGTYTVGSKTDTLQGVYNINKGYAVFKQIEVLFHNDDYTIVKKNTSYGLTNYDHIALQGNLINENDMIH